MSRLIVAALLLTSCAAEVAPRADAGDPYLLPLGATAALDGSFSEGDGLSYAWCVAPADGATLADPESPFATFTASAPGFYTLSLEVCDASGRCDVAETWARVDPPGSASKVSDWAPDEFAGSESGAGAVLSHFEGSKEWCAKCFRNASVTSSEWDKFCEKGLPEDAEKEDYISCGLYRFSSSDERKNWCRNYGCRG